VEDDRLVLANGKDGVVGKIGIVKDVSLETEEVTVEGVNTVN
jgi:ribosomal protein L24